MKWSTDNKKKRKNKSSGFKEAVFDHDSESFVRGWTIKPEICDKIVDNYERAREHSYLDQKRGYYRLPNSKLDKDIHIEYSSQVNACIEEYKKQYRWSHSANNDWGLAQPYNIQMYEPGSSYKHWHIESPGPQPGKLQRHLTFMTYLNDIEEGGETEFLYQSIDVVPKKGLTLIWPAGWTHPHRGRPAPNETKYIATGWCLFWHRC